MQIHNLKPKTKFRKSRRIGRGGKRGTYSGRGIKGMGARAGAKYRPAEREILKKWPKLRGYKFKPFRAKPAVINLADLEKKFKEGGVVSPETLYKAGLLRRLKGRLPEVKILGKGELKKKLTFKDVLFSRASLNKVGLQNTKKYEAAKAI